MNSRALILLVLLNVVSAHACPENGKSRAIVYSTDIKATIQAVAAYKHFITIIQYIASNVARIVW